MNNWDNIYTTQPKLPWGHGIPELFSKEKEFFKPYLESDTKKQILDYGFGTGDLLRHMKTFGHKVYGAEQSVEAIDKYLGVSNSPFIWKVIKTLLTPRIVRTDHPGTLIRNFPKMDLISCIGVLHHIDPAFHKSFLHGFRDMMKTNAHLIVAGWDQDDSFIRQGKSSKITNSPVFSINHLEQTASQLNMNITESDTIGFYDDMIYKMDRLLRFYVIENNK